jgi:hypothetical protein
MTRRLRSAPVRNARNVCLIIFNNSTFPRVGRMDDELLLSTTVSPNGYTIICISDTHGMLNKIESILPAKADIVIHAGDFTRRGEKKELESFITQFGSLPAPLKLFIAGNHELTLDRERFIAGDIAFRRRYFKHEGKTPEAYHNHCMKIVRQHSAVDSPFATMRYLFDEEVIILSESVSSAAANELKNGIPFSTRESLKIYGSPW